jgi:hypothetical protein
MFIGIYNIGFSSYEYVILLLSLVPWRCGRKWYIRILELCIPTFQDVVTRHYQWEYVLIVFGQSCLEDVDTRSSLWSFLTSLPLILCLNCVEIKYFWYDILLCAITILRSPKPSSITLRYVSLLWQVVSVYEKLAIYVSSTPLFVLSCLNICKHDKCSWWVEILHS